LARGGHSLEAALQRARPQVENPLTRHKVAVTHVEGFVFKQQTDQLAIGDTEDRLAYSGSP
jgi:hypothetical protein